MHERPVASSHSKSPVLPLARYVLHFREVDKTPLPGALEPGLSAWRGAFGHALKRAVCVTRAPDCKSCPLLHACSYPYLFETPPPPAAQKMRLYRAAPHPYLFTGWRREGERHVLGFTLIGRGNDYLPYVIYALEQAGLKGIGGDRRRFRLESVMQESMPGSEEWRPIGRPDGHLTAQKAVSPPLPSPPPRVEIEVLSPLRLQSEGKLVRVERFGFPAFFGSVLRRISMLSYFHTDTPLEADFARLMALAREVEINPVNLAWREWGRYSSRQRTAMKMGGLVGSFGIEGVDLAPFWPFLWIGQWVHAGKAVVMGNGGYRIKGAASLRTRTAMCT